MSHCSILWVEDEALVELQYLYAPLVVAGYDLHLAGDASRALDELKKKEFQVVIVDIRIPPGGDQRWQKLYYRYHADPAAARLGIHLLKALLMPHEETTEIRLGSEEVPAWIEPGRCAVFSVEVGASTKDDLAQLQLKHAYAKGPNLDEGALLNLVHEVLAERESQ
jgi:hypothetical protein